MSRLCIALMVGAAMGCQELPCNRRDVQKVIDDCRVEVAGPSFSLCMRAGLQPPPSFSWLDHSVENCSNQGAGRRMACMAARSHECRSSTGGVDYQRVEALVQSCGTAGSSWPSAPANLEPFDQCIAACDRQQQACSRACPTTDWDSCAACDTECARQVDACGDRC